MSGDKNIPSFDLTRNYSRVEGEIKEALERVLSSQQFIMGEDVRKFESEAASYLELPYAVSCASGTDALLLALMALGIGPGDEVITTPFSFFSTASCIVRLGARPVFADVHSDTYCIDIEKAIAAAGPKTKAFIPVHVFGQMSRLEDAVAPMKEKGIAIVEDCAQSFGAHRVVDGKIMRSASFGTLGCHSFFPTKNLGAYGDAGMVTMRDEALRDRVARLRVHGAASTYIHDEVGINSRMDTLQAAVLRVRLRHIEEWTEDRREIARRYAMLFRESGVGDAIRIPIEDSGARHTYHQYVVRAKDRDELQKYLAEKGIASRVYYPLPLHLQPCFASAGYKKGSFPEAERLCEEVLALPMFPELTMDEQERTVGEIKNFYKTRGGK